MSRSLSRAAIRELDRRAIEEAGIPGLILMENAALNLALEVLSFLEELGAPETARVLIACGPGNNGGDGLVLARQLHNRRRRPRILYIGDPDAARGDAAVNLGIARRMGLELSLCPEPEDLAAALREPADLVCDAYLGTGLANALRPKAIARIAAINAAAAPLLAVDIPSGLDCDSGAPLGAAVRAARTVTMAALKRGFAAAAEYTGAVKLVDIGAPRAYLEEAFAREAR